jgi:hypothetical protein
VKEQHKRDVDTFQTEKSSLQSRIDAEIDAMWRQTTGASHGTHSCLEQQKRSSAPNASTHISKVAHSPCALVPLSMVQKKLIVEEQCAYLVEQECMANAQRLMYGSKLLEQNLFFSKHVWVPWGTQRFRKPRQIYR